ncbi:unnamed protein product, partial [Rotaria magnacalcarata]
VNIFPSAKQLEFALLGKQRLLAYSTEYKQQSTQFKIYERYKRINPILSDVEFSIRVEPVP